MSPHRLRAPIGACLLTLLPLLSACGSPPPTSAPKKPVSSSPAPSAAATRSTLTFGRGRTGNMLGGYGPVTGATDTFPPNHAVYFYLDVHRAIGYVFVQGVLSRQTATGWQQVPGGVRIFQLTPTWTGFGGALYVPNPGHYRYQILENRGGPVMGEGTFTVS